MISTNQLETAENKINMLRIRELEEKVVEDTAEIQRKDSTIDFLQENKQAFDQIIQENDEKIIENFPKSKNSDSNPKNVGSSVVDEELLNEVKILQNEMKIRKQEEASSCGKTENILNEKYEKSGVQHEAISVEDEKHEMTDRLEAIGNQTAKASAVIVEVQNSNLELQRGMDTWMSGFKRDKHLEDKPREKNEQPEMSELKLKYKLHLSKQENKSNGGEIQKVNSSLRIAEGTVVQLNLEKAATNIQINQLESTDNQRVSKLIRERHDALKELRQERQSSRNEISILKESLNSAKTLEMLLRNQLCDLQKVNTSLIDENRKLADSEWKIKRNMKKMQKRGRLHKQKERELNQLRETMESDQVRLMQEVGAVNSQLCETKIELKEMTLQLDNASARAAELKQTAVEYQTDAENLRNENAKLTDELTKVISNLQILQKENDFLSTKSGNLDIQFLSLKKEKERAENDQMMMSAKLQDYEKHVFSLEGQIEQFKSEMNKIPKEVSMIRKKFLEYTEEHKFQCENLAQRLLAAKAKAAEEEKNNAELKSNCRTLTETINKMKRLIRLGM